VRERDEVKPLTKQTVKNTGKKIRLAGDESRWLIVIHPSAG